MWNSIFQNRLLVLLARETDLSIQNVSQPEFYKCFSAAMNMDCPATYEEAIASKDSKQWLHARKS